MIYESMELWVPKELNDTNSWRNRCIMAQGLLAVLSLFFTDEPEMSLAIKMPDFHCRLCFHCLVHILSVCEYLLVACNFQIGRSFQI